MSNFFSPAVKEEDLIDLKSGLENLLSKINSVLEQHEDEESDEEQTTEEMSISDDETSYGSKTPTTPTTHEFGGKKHKKKTGKRKGKKGGKKTRKRTK